jgi:tRNA-dihydrouridine synthase A
MMDHSDRHFRWFIRQITRRSLIYSEMVVMHAVLHGDRRKLLGFDPAEKPVSLQLGGDDPVKLAECARIAEDRVRAGCFGAALMATPDRVADCVAAMRAAVSVPVTVKHRIGIDDADRYEDLARFVTIVSAAGADRFTVHARKAVLGGLTPKENREIPPLRPHDVYALKREFPHLSIELNGGIRTVEAARAHLGSVDSVMVGRAAYESPWVLAEVDTQIFDDPSPVPTRAEVVERVAGYLAAQQAADPNFQPRWVLRHLVPLFVGVVGGARWRRILAERASEGPAALSAALAVVSL